MARANFAVRAPANGGRWSEYVAHEGEHAGTSMPGVFASVGAVTHSAALRAARTAIDQPRRLFSVSPPFAPFLRL